MLSNFISAFACTMDTKHAVMHVVKQEMFMNEGQLLENSQWNKFLLGIMFISFHRIVLKIYSVYIETPRSYMICFLLIKFASYV